MAEEDIFCLNDTNLHGDTDAWDDTEILKVYIISSNLNA